MKGRPVYEENCGLDVHVETIAIEVAGQRRRNTIPGVIRGMRSVGAKVGAGESRDRLKTNRLESVEAGVEPSGGELTACGRRSASGTSGEESSTANTASAA